MEVIRVIKKTIIPFLLIDLFIIGICIFRLQTTVDYTDGLYAQMIDADNKSAINPDEYLTECGILDEDVVKELTDKFNEQKNYIDNYKEDKQKAVINAGRMAEYSLFVDKTSYSYLKLQKSKEVAVNTLNAGVSLCNTQAIESFMDFYWVPLIFLMTGFVLVSSYKEEEVNRVNLLVRISAKGRTSLVIKRSIITFIYSFANSFIINSSIFGLFLKAYGGEKYLDCVIQSSRGYVDFPHVLSIKAFFIMYCILFALAMYAIFQLMYIFVQGSSSLKLAYAKIIITGIIEYILYISISPKSVLCVLKYINIFSIILLQNSISALNWGMDGFISDTLYTALIIMVVMVCIGLIANSIIYRVKYPIRKKNRIEILMERIDVIFQKILSRCNSFVHELYKWMFAQNGLLLIIIFFLTISSLKIYRGFNYEQGNTYCSQFYKQYEGQKFNDDVYQYIADLETEMQKLRNKEKISKLEKRQLSNMNEAYISLLNQVSYLEEVRTSRGIDVVILNEQEYNELLGDRMNDICENINAVCVIMIILSFANIYNYEQRTGMEKMINCSKQRAALKRNKLILMVLIILLVGAGSGIFNICNIIDVYSVEYMNVPLHSLSEYAEFGLNITILEYMLLCQVIRVIGMIIIGMIIAWISLHTGYLKSLFAGTLIMIPHILYIFNVPYMKYLSIPVWLDVNRIIRWTIK